MKIQHIHGLPPLYTNTFLITTDAGHGILIDAAAAPETYLDALKAENATLTHILLTHGHFDHCTGVAGLLETWPKLPVYIHKGDVTDSSGGDLLFHRLGEKNQRYYQEGDKLTVGGLTLDVLETPGHSQGSVCLLVEGQGVLFAGDTLFRGSCGRCDFPGGDYRAMLKSLARLGKLEGQYTVYPGHDSATDMDFERKYNPYMKQGMNV